MRVLIVEDDATLRDLTGRGLAAVGFAVDHAANGREALEKADLVVYDVVVLDRDLPEIHGDDVCRQLVQEDPRPQIVMLTAFDDIGDRVDGLDLGADDYVTKPFAMEELQARVRAAARRRTSRPTPPLLAVGDLTVDTSARRVTRAGQVIELRPKEFGVLETLLVAAPAIVSAEELLDRVWDENADPFTSAVRVTMANLRKKLGEPDPIVTHTGVGYAIACDR